MVKGTIWQDLYRYGGLSNLSGLAKAMFIPGFKFTYFYRRASCFKRRTIPGIFYRIILRHYSYKFGIQIPAGTDIGPGLYIGHFGNIVISSAAKIGRNCNIAQGVTIGKVSGGRLMGFPVIGNNVWIGTNSVIVGAITIGSNVLITPNSFVNFNVPDNSVVISHRLRIVESDDPTKDYINFRT